MSIGKRLREFGIKEFGQLKHLAKELGIAPSNLQKILKDERELTASMLLKLAHNNCDLRWLLTDKRDLFEIDHDMWLRVEIVMSNLRDKFSITKREIDIDKIREKLSKQPSEVLTEQVTAEKLYFTWFKHNSMTIAEMVTLTELMEVDLYWILIGKHNLDEQSKNAFLFKYPEIALLLELRKNPELFKKVKLYVDSVTSSTSTSELEKISNDINSISGADTTDKQKKEKEN